MTGLLERCSMAFIEIPTNKTVPEREREILEFWKKNRIFEKHVEATENGPLFVFFEGPPTANGRPGIHHVLSRVFKDVYVRYQGLQGKHIPRQAGWDCHGLPVEREVEKKLGIQTKSEIEEKVGLAEFNRMCRESVSQYVGDWNRFSERLAFWVDLDRAYFTMDNSFIESVWSLLKIIWDKGLMYQGYKVVPFDPVMGATMSDAEVALGYKTVEDPSFTTRFHLKSGDFPDDTSILVWTTTPWTLPSNVALAVAEKETYVLVKREIPAGGYENWKPQGKKGKKGKGEGAEFESSGKSEHLVCAKALMGQVFGEEKPEVLREFTGKDLKGLSYEPLIDWIKSDGEKKSHFILTADFVTMDTGTGIVHIAPAFGADDLEVGIQNDLPVVHGVGLDGKFIAGTPIAGTFFKDADPLVIKHLKERNMIWRSERYKHEYPFGWRTGAPLMYFAKDAWYIRTTEMRDRLIENNNQVNWVPDFIKHGRFGNWLENNRDWALSRERYWGTPLPVWTDGEGDFRIIGSLEELEKLSGKKLGDLDLHRPFIDEITFTDGKSGKTFRRVPEVIDAWFDSGSMPYAQWGWPIRGEKEFSKYFPADFISEAVDQTRGWFYTLLAVSTMVRGESPYKNVVCLGHVLDEKGEKMSKSKGNIVPPDDVFNSHGADAIRWYFLTGAPPGNSRRVGMPGSPGDPVAQVHGFFNMLVNSLNFFVMYAKVDNLDVDGHPFDFPFTGVAPFARRPEIDRWILSGLQALVRDVTTDMEQYDAQRAGKRIEEFTDSLSNWYIRRNRRRFWKGELDQDKLSAYDALFRCLVTLARLIAPQAPYLAEQMYGALIAGKSGAPESVHLAGWPQADLKGLYDEEMLQEGDLVQRAAMLGRAARMQSGVKVRQPLSRLMVHTVAAKDQEILSKNREVLLDELNVKELEFLDDSAGILDYRIKPNLPVLGKRLGSRLKEIQEYFKTAPAREIALAVKAGTSVTLPGSDPIVLDPEEILVESVSSEGVSGVEGFGMLVALDTELSEELLQEGMIRDLVRNVQELRKKSGLQITDRILLLVEGAGPLLTGALKTFGTYLEGETLGQIIESRESKGKSSPAGELEATVDTDKIQITIWLDS